MLKQLLPLKWQRKLWRSDLGTFIRLNRCQTGLELGAKNGRSMLAVLKQNPQLHYIGIDLWQDMPQSSPYKHNASNEQIARHNLRKFAHCKLWKGDCLALAERVDEQSLDFIFYDLYDFRWSNTDFVTSVLQAYLPKLKSNGLLISRDFDQDDCQQAFTRLNLPNPTPCQIKGRSSARLQFITINH